MRTLRDVAGAMRRRLTGGLRSTARTGVETTSSTPLTAGSQLDSRGFPTSLTNSETAFLVKAVNRCNKCWGRGHLGLKTYPDGSAKPLLCKCVKKAYIQIVKERQHR